MKATLGLFLVLLPCLSFSGELSDISNFRQYDDTFSSSGQPTKKQLSELADSGYERVIYVAYSDHKNSLPNEDRLVKELGMEYVHIPVEWSQPTKSDFYLFSAAMESAVERRTLLHCQVNWRASAFSFLYRVIHRGVSVEEAKKDLNSVWTPDEKWTALILEILDENNIDAQCPGCDWTPGKH